MVSEPYALSFPLPGGSAWVVRDDDVKHETIAALCAGAGAGLWLDKTAPTADLVAKAAIAAGYLARAIWSKGARLDPMEVTVVAVLKDRVAREPDMLAAINRCLGEGEKWTPSDLASTLASLQQKRLKNGTIVSLVAKNDDGWSRAGI